MTGISNFAFEDHLVRVVKQGDEPWFVGVDVCQALALKNHHTALERLDEDECALHTVVGTSEKSRARHAQEMIIVSEPGVFRLVFSSRKPEAERFKRWLAHEVLPELRRTGSYALPGRELRDQTGDEFEVTNESAAVLMAKLALVRECRHSFGVERSRALWPAIGLPLLPMPPRGGADEGRECLGHLRLGMIEGRLLSAEISDGLNDDPDAQQFTRANGIIAEPDRGILVANRHPSLELIFGETSWANHGWARALRQLPGASAAGMRNFGRRQARATFVPDLHLNPYRTEGADLLQ